MAPLAPADHRPWPLPGGPWVMAQTWSELLFAHWSFPPEVVAPLLPEGLTLHTHDGRAWIGVVPFLMSGVRLRGLPPLPGTSAFPELNVRTYVTAGGRPGVWFFSLDAASALAVAAARAWFSLPYHRAAMEVEVVQGAVGPERVHYRSRRTHRGSPPAALDARYGPVGPPAPAAPGSLAHFLTERYRLYALGRDGRLRHGEIHHGPWPLQPARARWRQDTMLAPFGLEPQGAPLLHFAARLDVVVWAPRQGV